MTKSIRLAAATVLHHPDAVLLNSLCGALRASGIPLLAVCNSPLDEDLRAELAGRYDVTLLGAGANIGLGEGLNTAMAAAEDSGFSHVLLLDQDSTPHSSLPQQLTGRLQKIAAPLGGIGPRLTPPAGEGYKAIWYSFRKGGRPGAQPVDFLPTSGSLIPIVAWRSVGPFRADFFIDGIDIEWSFRAWRAGFQMILADDLAMLHRWGQPDTKMVQPQIFRQGLLRNAYYLRNNVYSLRLPHIPWSWKKRILLRLAAQTLALTLRGEGPGALKAIRSGWRGELGAIS